jgi:hypothetical protein
LREAFARWGMPWRVRVDNGAPWGSTGELPTDLALWLIGLGVGVIWNPPRRPQFNGVVERSQGTGKRWAEPGTCPDEAELRRRLEEQDHIQRALYPRVKGLSRMEAFPGLRHSGRSYGPEQEAVVWDLARVLDHLAGYALVRQVDSSGTVSVYSKSRYAGKDLCGKEVYISIDPVTIEWVYSGPNGVCYRRQKAEELTAERIRGLDVSQHRQRESQARPAPPPG